MQSVKPKYCQCDLNSPDVVAINGGLSRCMFKYLCKVNSACDTANLSQDVVLTQWLTKRHYTINTAKTFITSSFSCKNVILLAYWFFKIKYSDQQLVATTISSFCCIRYTDLPDKRVDDMQRFPSQAKAKDVLNKLTTIKHTSKSTQCCQKLDIYRIYILCHCIQ